MRKISLHQSLLLVDAGLFEMLIEMRLVSPPHTSPSLLFLPAKTTVIYLGKNKKGQHQLSRKAVLEARGVKPRGGGGGGGGRDYGGRRMETRQPADGPAAAPEIQMSKEEMEVISNAIEKATE